MEILVFVKIITALYFVETEDFDAITDDQLLKQKLDIISDKNINYEVCKKGSIEVKTRTGETKTIKRTGPRIEKLKIIHHLPVKGNISLALITPTLS